MARATTPVQERGDLYRVDGVWKTVGGAINPFYEQPRKPLPIEVQRVLSPNQIRVGGGTDIFTVTGSGFIFRSDISSSTTAGFGTDDELVNQIKVTNSNNKDIMAIVERAIYIGTKTAAYLLPGGASIDESQFQVIGGNFSILDTSGDTMGTNQLASHLYIRNISAGTVTVYIDTYVRYIINEA